MTGINKGLRRRTTGLGASQQIPQNSYRRYGANQQCCVLNRERYAIFPHRCGCMWKENTMKNNRHRKTIPAMNRGMKYWLLSQIAWLSLG